MKTSVLILFMLTSYLNASTARNNDYDLLIGTWNSVFQFQGISYQLSYRFSVNKKNELEIHYDNPGLEMFNIKALNPKFDGKTLSYSDDTFQMEIKGDLSKDKKTLILNVYKDKQYFTEFKLTKVIK